MTHPHLQIMSVAQCTVAYDRARTGSKMDPADFDAEVLRRLASSLSTKPAKPWHFVAVARVVARLSLSEAA